MVGKIKGTLAGAGLVLGSFAAMAGYTEYKLGKFPPEERAAIIRYYSRVDLIGTRRASASECIRGVEEDLLAKDYAGAKRLISSADMLIASGESECPPKTIGVGSECVSAFASLRRDLDEEAKKVESAIKAGKEVR